MSRRPLVLALAFALLPLAAPAPKTCCRPTSWHAPATRSCPPPNPAASSTKEGAVQARAALLPQINGSAVDHTAAEQRQTGTQVVRQRARSPATAPNDSTTRSYGVNLRQMVYDHATSRACAAPTR